MNSCRSIEFCACAPPLITFSIGTGSVTARVAAEIAVERDALVGRAGLGRGERDTEDRVRAQPPLVRRAVELDQPRGRALPGRAASRAGERARRSRRSRSRRRARRPCRPTPGRRRAARRPRARRSRRRTGPRPGRARPTRGARRPRRSDCRASRRSRARGRPRSVSTPLPLSPGRSSGPARRGRSSAQVLPSPAASRSARSTRPGSAAAALRSSSSGSTFSRRATFTHAKSTSPSSAAARGSGSCSGCRLAADLGAQLDAALRRGRRALRRHRDSRSRQPPRGAGPFCARSSAGRLSGTSWKTPTRPSCSRFSRSQATRTWPALAASASPKTCGWRAIELGRDAARDLFEAADAPLLEQEREEVGLEQQIAELVEELLVVTGERRVGDFVRLLDRVRHDRLRRLRAVPGAVAAKPYRQLLELQERLRQAQAPVVVVPVARIASQGSGFGT